MRKAATSGQFREFIGKLLTKTKEEKIDGGKIQEAIDAIEKGMIVDEFTRWINNGCKTIIEATKHFLLPEVTSYGTTGKKWIGRLQKKECTVSDQAQDILRKKAFVDTNGKTYKSVVVFGHEFEDEERITANIREKAKKRGYVTPPAELAPNLREMISNEEMEKMDILALIVMHEPIKDSGGDPRLLVLGRYGDSRWLRAYCGSPGYEWDRKIGFVFLLSQD